MWKTILIVVITIVVLLGIGYGLYYYTENQKEEEEKEPTDEISVLLENIKNETGIEFSDVQDVEVVWNLKKGKETTTGKGFGAERILSEDYRKIWPYLENQGFEVDVYNVAAGTIASQTGYRKDDMICTVTGGATGYKEAEGRWIPPEPDLKDVEVKCGKLEMQENETADWQNYTNEKYGYSLKYPSPCLLGPLPGYCKQDPPEERPTECRCFLNGEDPDSVMMQAFTGTKSDLTGASISISHNTADVYNPPVDTDLIEWIKEKFSYLENIPAQTNFELDSTPAVKIYTPQSPQAYSQENIFFLHNNLLFNIYMNDVDNVDNRELYNNILSTFELASWETMDVKTDEEFSIFLDSNPTTGYSWQVELGDDLVELVKKEYVASEPELIGSGGHERFDFKALKAGEAEVTFSYARSWESVQPIEKVIYKITVE